jgi:hypothetical protein
MDLAGSTASQPSLQGIPALFVTFRYVVCWLKVLYLYTHWLVKENIQDLENPDMGFRSALKRGTICWQKYAGICEEIVVPGEDLS